MSKRRPTPRAMRRAADRACAKLARIRERVASLESGGASDHPIEVCSASLVEPTAAAVACPRCGAARRVDEHAAVVVDGRRLRVARTRCAACGLPGEVWFRIGTALPS